jgi:hypothetical protein
MSQAIQLNLESNDSLFDELSQESLVRDFAKNNDEHEELKFFYDTRRELLEKQHLENRMKCNYCLKLEDIPDDSKWLFCSFTPSTKMFQNLFTPLNFQKKCPYFYSKEACGRAIYQLKNEDSLFASDYIYTLYIYPQYPIELKSVNTKKNLLNMNGWVKMTVEINNL